MLNLMLFQRRFSYDLWYDAFIGTDLEAAFILDLDHAGFHCNSRKVVDGKSITYKLYKKGTFTLQGATAESRGRLITTDTTPYVEATFTNQSVKIVLRNKKAIWSTITVKLGLSPTTNVMIELEKIVRYIGVLYN